MAKGLAKSARAATPATTRPASAGGGPSGGMGEGWGKPGGARHRGDTAAGVGGDDGGVLRVGGEGGRRGEGGGMGRGGRGRDPPRRRVVGEAGQFLGQHFTRQR